MLISIPALVVAYIGTYEFGNDIYLYCYTKKTLNCQNINTAIITIQTIALFIYMSFPYHLTDLYVRNAMGEFVSFGSDGYVCMRYDGGIFQGEITSVEGEYINTKGYFQEGVTILLDVLGEFDGKSMSIFSIEYLNGKKVSTKMFFNEHLTKTDDTPCTKSNKVLGGQFQQDGSEEWLGKIYRTKSDYTVEDFYRIKNVVCNRDNGEYLFDTYVNYVYLPPYIYMKRHTCFDENGVERAIETRTVSVYKVSFDTKGTPSFKFVSN